MTYRELVKRVQDYSGFSDSESEKALRVFISTLAARITEDERKDFASQLPSELQDEAMSVNETTRFDREDMYQAIADLQDIEPDHAKKQVMAAWKALKDQVTPGEIEDIKSQLPKDIEEDLR